MEAVALFMWQMMLITGMGCVIAMTIGFTIWFLGGVNDD